MNIAQRKLGSGILLAAGLALLIALWLLGGEKDDIQIAAPHLVEGLDSANKAADFAALEKRPTPLPPDEAPSNSEHSGNGHRNQEYDSADLAGHFGIVDYGLLTDEEKSKVRQRLNREIEGKLKRLSDPNLDDEAIAKATFSMLKYQEGLALFEDNQYLTTDPVAIPGKKFADYEPITLLNAANLDGKRVAVVLPIRIKPGSELDAMKKFAEHVTEQRLSRIIIEFNSQPSEVRARKIRDMLEIKSQLAEWDKKYDRGEITSEVLTRHWQELNPRLPPKGIAIDTSANLLRRD